MLQKKSVLAVFVCLAAGLTVLLPQQVSADEVVLDNGVHLTGTVSGLAGDMLTITSDYADPIKVKTSKIVKITTDNPVEIRMKNGEILKGNLKTGGDGTMVVEQHAGRGTVRVDLKNITAINPPLVNQWSGSVIATGNYQTGNTDRSAFRLGADAVRRGEKDRFSMRFLYDISE